MSNVKEVNGLVEKRNINTTWLLAPRRVNAAGDGSAYEIALPAVLNINVPATMSRGVIRLVAAKDEGDKGGLKRADVPVRYTWKLSDIYRTGAQWEKVFKGSEAKVNGLFFLKQNATASGKNLYHILESIYSLKREVYRLRSYAMMLKDQDTTDAAAKARYERADRLNNNFEAAVAFLRPAVIILTDEQLIQFMAEEPRLKIYGHFLDDIVRTRAHTLPPEAENVLAKLKGLGDASDKIFDIYKNAVMPRPTIKLSTGKSVELTDAAYTQYRNSPVMIDRTLVFDEQWKTYSRFQKLFAETLNQKVYANVQLAKARGYMGALDAALYVENITPKVYDSLIEGVHNGLPVLHRYFALRKKMLGLEKLGYQDMYASLIPSVKIKYSIEAGNELILKALKPLGEDYLSMLRNGFANRWADFMPTKGKKSGAYMMSECPDPHPYVLLNFMGDFDSVSTVAHEFGHAGHTWYTGKDQPFVYTQYSSFIAEVASTINEILLSRYTIANTSDKKVKLALLGELLDKIRTTVFRQTMFAEFEKIIYDKVWNGESLTEDVLNKTYGDLLRKYYGHPSVTDIDDRYSVEWAYVPHFYYNFYVYNYATSITASLVLAKRILDGVPGAAEAYLAMLKKGGSEYPVEILKSAGIDMTTTKPYKALVEEMGKIMDEIEKLIGSDKK